MEINSIKSSAPPLSPIQRLFLRPHSVGPGLWSRAVRLFTLGLTIGAAVSVTSAQSPLPASFWMEASDLDMESLSASAGGIAADNAGNVFVAGFYKDAAGISYGIIRRSTDKGDSWEDSDGEVGAQYLRMASRDGETVAAGVTGGNCLIRRTVNSGLNWDSSILPHPHPNYTLKTIWDVDLDENGNLYGVVSFDEKVATVVVGKRGVTTTSYSTVTRYALLRRQSGLWTWVSSSGPITKIACSGNDIYCIDNTTWKVRKSTDRGNTWTHLNSYEFENDPYTFATDITADNSGTLYVTGTGRRIVPLSKRSNAFYPYWVVRRGTPPAAGTAVWAWETDAIRFGAESAENKATAVTVDSNNQVHVVVKVGVDGLDRLASRWLTRQYSLSPVTGTWSWETTDSVDLGSANGHGAHGNRITADLFGNAYSKGGNFFGDGWIIRRKLAP